MKKIYSILLIVIFLTTGLYADGTQPPGSGTSDVPYEVSTLNHLLWISTNSGSWSACFEQTADINASATATWNSDGEGGYEGFSPIGKILDYFEGSYDGQGYAIEGLYINRTSDYVGLFGAIEGGSVENLILKNVNITAEAMVGGLAGYTVDAVFTNCSVSGSVSCINSYVGGLIGDITLSTQINECRSLCSVSGTFNVGGLVGCTYNSTVIKNSYARGSVDGTLSSVGGLLGYNSYGCQVNNCYATGSVSGDSQYGGLVGENNGTVSNSFYDQETTGQDDTGKGTPKTTEEMKTLYTFTNAGWDFDNETTNGTDDVWDIDYINSSNIGYPYLSWQDGATVAQPSGPDGSGTSNDPYQISNLTDLCWLSQNPSSWDKYFIQINDIDASSTSSWSGGFGFSPIGNNNDYFEGSYDGQGYAIEGLYINRSSSYVGLFGDMMGTGPVKNLIMRNVNITGDTFVGGLVGQQNYKVITNCSVTGSVSGAGYVGGVVGLEQYSAEVNECRSLCSVSGTFYVGSLVGGARFSAVINNSYARGSVDGTNSYIGGLLGGNADGCQVNNCYATGSVSGDSQVGGLVGENEGTVSNSFYDQITTGQDDTGKGSPKTTAEMKDYTTFINAGWDYVAETVNGSDDDWDQDCSESINNGYPYLSWQDGASVSLAVLSIVPSAGDGSSGDPYQIATINNLYWLSQNSDQWGQNYIQVANIDASVTGSLDSGSGFSSIGSDVINFSGTYDGQGYNIDNLYINRSASSFIGLFGYTNGAGISNIALTGANITGDQYVGGIAGVSSSGQIVQCYTKGSISGNYNVGGVSGCNNNTTIRNCYSTADISGTTNTGGLTGLNGVTSTIDKCYARGSVSGTTNTGGLVGANSATVSNSFFDSETTGQSDNSGKGVPKSTQAMQTFSTFFDAGWDLEVETGNGNNDIWDMDHTGSFGGCYPYLSWQDASDVSIPAKPADGDGSSGAPYQIATLSDLAWISLFANKWGLHFIQTANIDASTTGTWFNGSGFSPIGNSSTEFTGSYDGQLYSISGLTINRSSTSDVGLFGRTSGAILENIAVINADITGNDAVGCLVGNNRASSTVSKSYSTGTVSGNINVGGITGLNYNASLAQCYVTAGVSGASDVGGLVGSNYISATTQKCYARGDVTGTSNIGGLAGSNAGGTVSRCYATGEVSGSSNTGGLVGNNNNTVTDSFYDEWTSGCSDTGKGEPVNTVFMKIHLTFTDANWDFATETANGSNDVWDMDYNQAINSGYPYLSWQDGSSVSLNWTAAAPADGEGTSGDPYQIANLENLAWLSLYANHWDKYYIQTANIDASATSTWNGGVGFSPIGNNSVWFTGNYDGQSYTITGLTIDRSGTNNIGLFGYTNDAVIKNLGVLSVNITGNNNVGSLIGNLNAGTVKKCYSNGSVSGNAKVGGLAGSNNSGLLGQCFANTGVSGATDIGGLVGYNNYSSDVNNCYAKGSVSGTSNVGGLAGSNVSSAILNKSYAKGSVSGSSASGGLVGFNAGDVIFCFYDLETTGCNDTGKGIPKSTTDMKILSTFTDADWDFEAETANGNNDFWDLDCSCSINNGYPFLSWLNGEDVALPVELYSFTAVCDNGIVILEWQTASERDNLGFILERRDENSNWQEINSYKMCQTLQGQGTTPSETEYSYIDDTISPGNTYTYRLLDVNTSGAINVLASILVKVESIPTTTQLYPAYPNPFNPSTTIRYDLAKDGYVSIAVYDVLGRQVRSLFNGEQAAGSFDLQWNGLDDLGCQVSSGIYLVRFQTGNFTRTQKVMFVK